MHLDGRWLASEITGEWFENGMPWSARPESTPDSWACGLTKHGNDQRHLPEHDHDEGELTIIIDDVSALSPLCPYCDAPLLDDGQVCDECGANLPFMKAAPFTD